MYLFCLPEAFPQKTRDVLSASKQKELTLISAAMCEGIKDHNPWNKAVVFSVSIGKVCCFNSFDPVPEKTVIYHNWFRRDKLSTRVKLSLQPPRWSTFSRIQLREADKGPWRLEITDRKGNLLHILKFSIVD
jgi:hypothetical protein